MLSAIKRGVKRLVKRFISSRPVVYVRRNPWVLYLPLGFLLMAMGQMPVAVFVWFNLTVELLRATEHLHLA